MKFIIAFCLLLLLIFTSCKNNNNNQEIESIKALKQKELVFENISKSWNFIPRVLSPESQVIAANWNEWRLFLAELSQKPKGTIGAFQRKSKSLVQKADVLSATIPEKINKPQIKSRLKAMVTKIKMLHTFINLDAIPEKKVVILISDLNIELSAFQDQIEEITKRNNIRLEEGEAEMLNAVKGTQATPTSVNQLDSLQKQ